MQTAESLYGPRRPRARAEVRLVGWLGWWELVGLGKPLAEQAKGRRWLKNTLFQDRLEKSVVWLFGRELQT